MGLFGSKPVNDQAQKDAKIAARLERSARQQRARVEARARAAQRDAGRRGRR